MHSNKLVLGVVALVALVAIVAIVMLSKNGTFDFKSEDYGLLIKTSDADDSNLRNGKETKAPRVSTEAHQDH